MTIEERLTDALRPYRDVEPSPELWERIEANTQRRSWAKAPWILAAAAVLVVIAVIGASIAQRSETKDQLTAGRVTRQQFVERADQLCAEFGARIEGAQVVFPTPTGYAVVADQLLQIAKDALTETETAPVPEELRGTVAANRLDLQRAVAAAGRARESADAGDTADAQDALREYNGAMARVGDRLASNGAASSATVGNVVPR